MKLRFPRIKDIKRKKRSGAGQPPSGSVQEEGRQAGKKIGLHFENAGTNASSGMLVFIVLGSFFLMMCVCAAVFFIMVKGPEEVLVPNVEGKELVTALIEMQEKELYPRIQTRYSDTPGDEGTILSQNPAGGAIVKAYGRVDLVVSRGIIVDKIEDYVGQKLDDVNLRIQTLFSGASRSLITVGQPLYKADVSEAGTVLEQDPPAGTEISEPITLKLVVSRGPAYEQTRIPDLKGMSVNDVLLQMGRSKIIFDFTSREATGGEKPGTVISQQSYGREFIANYSRLTAEFAMPKGETDGLVYGIFTTVLEQYPYALQMRLDVSTPDGEAYTLVNLHHTGGQFTVPYAVPKGSVLTLFVADRAERKYTVS